MNYIEEYEEKYTSAYCRLSYEVWYQYYKDDISEYLKQYDSMDKVLSQVMTEKRESKVIRINSVSCQSTYEMKEYIEAIIRFHYMNEEYMVICALPYEQHKEADRIAYNYISNNIDEIKFIEEMHERDYMLMIWSISRNSDRYLKVLPEGTCSYAIHYLTKEIKRGKFQVNRDLYEELIEWAKKYVADNSHAYHFTEGMPNVKTERFRVIFNMEKFGYESNDWNIVDYGFDVIDGHGVISKFLKMPELAEFVMGEVK